MLLAFGCQSKTEEGSIASTHPELVEQLAEDTIPMPITGDQASERYQGYRITMEEYMNSGQYEVGNLYRGRLAPLDENSHTDSRTYRTALREGLKEGVNFAGKYTVVTVECGRNCQMHYVIDRENGKLLDKLQSTAGAKFSPSSRLFIINPPDPTLNYSECRDCTPEAFVFDEDRFRQLPTAE